MRLSYTELQYFMWRRIPKKVTLHLEEYKPSILKYFLERLYKSRNHLYDGVIVKLWSKNYRIIRKQVRDVAS